MRMFFILSAFIIAVFFLYPFFVGDTIFTTFDKVSGSAFFQNNFTALNGYLKEILGTKTHKIIVDILLFPTWETLYMTINATIFASILGLFIAIILVLTRKGGLIENKAIYTILDIAVNTIRSFPSIVLIIVLFPFVKLIVGTSIGTDAAIIPLTIGTAPFMARLIENALIEVDSGIIEAAKSFGASKFQIIFRVMLVEAIPALINVVTLTIIVVIGFSAMAGILGGGGLGDIAIRYGFQRFRPDIMTYTVIILVLMVQFFQSVGDILYKLTKK